MGNITEDLFAMYWKKLSVRGNFAPTKQITCYWTDHPFQRHKIISESFGGGLNFYRKYYDVGIPIKLRVYSEKFIDEKKMYNKYTNIKVTPVTSHPLKILIVGELAYNPERIIALEEYGHKLYGLWIERPQYSFQTVGPLPFGNIEDIPIDDWENRIKKIQPDIIYGLLNTAAIPLAYDVLCKFKDIPFVWHFKEGPSIALRTGLWKELLYLYTFSDGKIFINETIKEWYHQFIPSKGLSLILDGDLPKNDFFNSNFSQKLSASGTGIHTLVAGRMIGIDFSIWKTFINKDIHIHVYTESYIITKEKLFNEMKRMAPNHFHLHKHCPHDKWVEEFSKYDAGWLHAIDSSNNGNLMQASWDDLNIPARISTYAAAGLPMILKDNTNHIVATHKKVKELDIGIFFQNYGDLERQLKDEVKMKNLRTNVISSRAQFHFDYHVSNLISFFEKVIKSKKSK